MARFGDLDVTPGDYVQYRDSVGARIRGRIIAIETEDTLGEAVWVSPLIKPAYFNVSPNVAALGKAKEKLDNAIGFGRLHHRASINSHRDNVIREIREEVARNDGRLAPPWAVPCDPSIAERLGATVSEVRILAHWPWQGVFVGDFVWLDIARRAAVPHLGPDICFAVDALEPSARRITVTATCLGTGGTHRFCYDAVAIRKVIATAL
ncbi:hypothetical protein [Nocardia acidivorans]|uniref:hypothetical protein n=1 Tax=Nocardia acidivorans TaxID=404580 RepID=UPI00082F6C38|nr:hypothetical protein [Nocardia acidivorans]